MSRAGACLAALFLTAMAAPSSPALAQGDPALGETLYRPCRACHMIGDGAVHRVGPHLNGLVARPIGASPGYEFSADLATAGAEGATWTVEALDRFLAGPREYFPGTRMVFRGIRSEADRAHLIAYMQEAGGPADAAIATEELAVDPEVAAITALTADVPYGEYLANECTACHQASGGADIPSIRGLAPSVFVAGMVAYRNGTREHQVMNTVSRRLGDEEIAALAAYFATVD
ncbi:c-type cytochrome [Roseicyclus mahoneyensis]|uniref:Cytochrome c n=1 Tax=Roseicyclus mahoneyensis TaxID=164332 RepID=A0A316H424_9RHOB|nr:c-type cytochrome [Roseicyclus mahoneyensis]PWK62293.1 cytochrome c [Roseicyclus mahoneyensis]